METIFELARSVLIAQYYSLALNGEKPFMCTECIKLYFQAGHFKKHMRTHMGEKPFVCTQCNKSCSHSGNLKVQMRNHTGEKPFMCTLCNKSFSKTGYMKKHMRTYTSEKTPFFATSVISHSNSHIT
jgi:uncharacterized Zn-finger protein